MMGNEEFDKTVQESLEQLITIEIPENPHGPTSLTGETVAHYQLESLLGEGGSGQVYLATDQQCGRQVALKLLRPQMRELLDPEEQERMNERFAREVHAAQCLCHPNLIQVLDYQSNSQHGPFFAMEYLEGQTLKRLLKRSKGLPKEELIAICGQICDALKAIHDKGIVYRDLKPGNVYIVPIYRHKLVKLLDFGIALLPYHSRLSVKGEIVGTPQYMSPEQILDPSKITPVSDVYSFGMLFYLMLTGERLIKERNLTKLYAAHCQNKKPLDHPAVTVPIRRALSKLLLMNPEQRPPSIEEAWNSLEDALESEWSAASLLK